MIMWISRNQKSSIKFMMTKTNSLKIVLQIAENSCEFSYDLVYLHSPSSICITQCWFVHLFLSRTLLCRYIISKVEPSFVYDIKMEVDFDGVRQYVGWLIFMCKVTCKIRFNLLLGISVGFMNNVAVTFSVLKSIYE